MVKKNISRRSFVKGLAAGTASLAMPFNDHKAEASDTSELVTLLDLSRCIGCGECVEACRTVNGHKFPQPQKPFPEMVPKGRAKVEDWSDRREVDDRLTPYNWLYIESVEVEYKGVVHEINIPRRCLHCQNPPCANLCPWGAAEKQQNGIVRIQPDVCLGGAKCRTVCPWHIPQRQTGVGLYLRLLPGFAGNGVMYKCDRCYDRIDKGELPACIEACPESVQKIGPRREILNEVHNIIHEKGWFAYGLEENGGTNTVYLSPVPFELLDAASRKGPGLPGLNKVDAAMEDEENLAAAVAIAPFAGLVAGMIKAGRFVSSKLGKQEK
ncbi:4Fe-4S dicluster domain-containing protein [Maridesulfovibrio bastinii]|uniref:4Fe-4S dicluster domain-containing protein n=1 Tax=Maridesulfovibrio bastinii TaxID=47157 RepID=UPI0003FA4FFC|nr:4Fe-4S dicluster domain-containing protein [Maridesulfovibrio bastinii]